MQTIHHLKTGHSASANSVMDNAATYRIPSGVGRRWGGGGGGGGGQNQRHYYGWTTIRKGIDIHLSYASESLGAETISVQLCVVWFLVESVIWGQQSECVCVRAGACACVCACVRECVSASKHVSGRMCSCTRCQSSHSTTNIVTLLSLTPATARANCGPVFTNRTSID